MIAWPEFAPGEYRLECPGCGRGKRDKTMGVTVERGAGVAHCFRCQFVETWRDERTEIRPGKAPARPATPRKRAALADYGLELWNACTGLRGTSGEEYLLARRCALPPVDGDLRYHPAMRHPSGYTGPALVALVTDAITGQPLTLHRTWIARDGSKADVDPPRLLLGGHRKQGGVVRLWPDEAVDYGLGIAEGIETALTLATALRPVWSLIDAGNLAAFPVLPGIEALTIAADNDPAGIAAAEQCGATWALADVDVRLVLPPRPGADLNDVARGAA